MSSRRAVWGFVLGMTLIGAGVLTAAIALRGPHATTAAPAVLVWDVPDELSEGEPPRRPFGFGWLHHVRPTMLDVLDLLDHATNDDHVRALVLHVGDLDWGWARLGEVRDAIARFHATGKPVYAYVESGGDPEYFLATVADVIALPPAGTLQVDGLSATATFLRGALDKLNVHPNFAQAGEYKSAVEFFTRGQMSPAAREALDALLDDTFRVLVDSLATGRGLPPDSIRALIDEGPFSAREARRAGLADTLSYEEQIDSLAVRHAGPGVEAVMMSHYDAAQRPRWGARVAYVSASGEIASGKSRVEADGTQVIGSETLVKTLRDVRERRSLKAVVLRIDSPGGEVDASDEIWHEVRRLAAVKPVIVSMSDLAASGGYYIAAPATKIVAQPGTITGSIGVFAGKLNVLGLYQKLGLNVEVLTRGRHAGLMSPFRDFTPEEAARFQAHVDDSYRIFLSRVANGRHLTTGAVDHIARGRVWSGLSARPRALVDSLGGIPLAFHLALQAAGLPEDSPFAMEEYPRTQQSFFERVLQGWLDEEADDNADASARLLPEAVRTWVAMALLPPGHPLAMMPWTIRIR